MRVATLLMLVPAMLPLLCPVKLAAALVLLPVSAASVVVALKGVDAFANSDENKMRANGRQVVRYKNPPGCVVLGRRTLNLHLNESVEPHGFGAF